MLSTDRNIKICLFFQEQQKKNYVKLGQQGHLKEVKSCPHHWHTLFARTKYFSSSTNPTTLWLMSVVPTIWFSKFWKTEFIHIHRPGQSNWEFDCGYSTVWKFSNFLPPLCFYVKFGWFSKVKNCHFNNFGGFEYWFLEKFHTWKCQNFPKI